VCGHIADHDGTGSNEGMVPETTTTTPASKVTPRCIVVVSSSGPWRLMCAPRAQIIGEDDPRAEDDIVSDMHAFKDHHLVLACDRSPTDAPFSTNAPSQTLQSRPMRAAARTWANAQTRVPYPTLVLSQSPFGCTETPYSDSEAVTAPPITSAGLVGSDHAAEELADLTSGDRSGQSCACSI
jgi:hypothetical protein